MAETNSINSLDQMPARWVLRRFRWIPGQPVAYIQNPKAGCTSIELTLWRRHDPSIPTNPHALTARKASPFISNLNVSFDLEELLAARFASVVRNPYVRFVSAYLDKVHTAPNAWARIAATMGADPSHKPTVAELLDILRRVGPCKADHHFRPQHVNLLYGYAPLDALGHMEVEGAFAPFGDNLANGAAHATGAATKLHQTLSASDLNLVREYYNEDFRLFGYSPDPDHLLPDGYAKLQTSREWLRQKLQAK